MFKLLGVPAVLVTGSVVVIVSSTWSLLDPTLEPHLRQVRLTTKKYSHTIGVSEVINKK